MSLDIEALRSGIGREIVTEDIATAAPVAAMSATLDRSDPPPKAGDPLPPLWHWMYFLDFDKTSSLGPDGLPPESELHPHVPLPRRMWAGARFTFHRPLRVGERLTRRSSLDDVRYKEGRTGPLVFVRIRHEVSGENGLAVVEENESVHRGPETGGAAAPLPQRPPLDPVWRRSVEPSAALLFRYSALTFNPHRIHYDRPYTMEQEGYPGLIVHGPLQATLLMDLLRRERPDAQVENMRFRALAPLFDDGPFAVCGAPTEGGAIVWTERGDGTPTMQADVTFAD